MSTHNTVTVTFSGSVNRVTAPDVEWQHDQKQTLIINGLDLPDHYIVDFCNEQDPVTKPVIGTAEGVEIPDEYLLTGERIKAFIVLSGDDGDVQTRYEITIPVQERPRRSDLATTPVDRKRVDDAIDLLNSAVEDARDAADDAEAQVRYYPKVVDGYWYTYDKDAGTWGSTGIPAQGAPGEITATSVADRYDASDTYDVGDYCVYSGQLYRCSTAIPTAEEWDEDHWTAVTLTEVSVQPDWNQSDSSAADYVKNKPTINSVELVGALTAEDLGLGRVYYDTTANWNLQQDLVGTRGAVYIYSDYDWIEDDAGNRTPVAGIKIGDGNAYLIDTTFVSDAMTYAIIRHVADPTMHVSQQEREFWNHKVSAYVVQNEEKLVLSQTQYEKNGEIHTYQI